MKNVVRVGDPGSKQLEFEELRSIHTGKDLIVVQEESTRAVVKSQSFKKQNKKEQENIIGTETSIGPARG